MATSTSVHSNAFNFMSFLENGVDPRTGQYTVSITLPELKTNKLRGPGMPLALTYNPLNTLDSGYGHGWNLQLSQYTPGNQILSLSSGETFKVTDSSGDRLLMKEQKLDSFRFYKQDDSHYRLVHKSGLVEILEVRGSTGNQVALPVRVFAAEGHSISLDYQTFSSTQQILRSITDDAGTTLLSVDRDSSSVRVVLYAADGPSVPFVMELSGSERHVSRISLPTDNQASWRFEYARQRDHLCLVKVQTPSGGEEELFYQDGGHPFPVQSGRAPLPRVTRHLIRPGFGQPPVDVRYTYRTGTQQEHNFLGAGLSINWADDGLDNLYKHPGDYEYVCTESLWVDDREVRSIERIFNRFHLLTSEATTQNNNQSIEQTEYHLVADRPFDQQPNYCQLPREVTRQWRLLDNPTRSRSEKISSSYDSYGNLLVQTQANGVVEENIWYPATASDGCPADPEGFVRNLREKIVRPAPSTYGQAPTLSTRYRYMALPAVAASQGNDWLASESETLVQIAPGAEQVLQQTHLDYIDNPGDAFLHGRVQRETVTLGALDTITEYAYSTLDSPDFGESVQRTVQTLRGFDGEEKIIILEHSLLTGEPLLNRDDNDVQIRYVYDNLRRVLRETVAPGTPYEAARRYEYTLCASVGEQAEQWMFDVKGVKTCTRFDGLNRAIYEERADADNPARAGEPRQTYGALYDAWGNLARETEYDWLEDQDLALTSTFEYDDWGQQRCVTGPDGVSTFEETDPIGSTGSQGPIQRSWTQSSGANPLKSGVSETWLNLFEKPTRTERLDLGGTSISLTQYHYDGLGRTIEEVVGLAAMDPKRITAYVYDAFDRMTASTLPDNAIVHRSYAAHSSDELPTTISVEDKGKTVLLGEQQFDGLGRMTRSITGGRERLFSYDPGQSEPKTVTTPSGQSIGYQYLPQLGSEPLQRRLPGSVTADYAYDPQNARLLNCLEQGEQLTREYFSTGELKSEQRQSAGAEYSMHYRYSRLGRLLGYTDVLGQEQHYEYDPQGRLEQTRLGSTNAQFSYDALGRTATIVTSDSASGQHVGLSLEYDDFGRETLRSFDLDGTAQELTQVYDDTDKLSNRTLREGATLIRDEDYRYDLRGRLTQYDCQGSQPPVDPYGKTLSRQIFSFDGVDNLTLVISTSNAGTNRAQYFYEKDDPVQLSRVTNNHTDYPSLITLDYDSDGNLIRDEASRSLVYDALGRLIEVGTLPAGSQYRYDPLDSLTGASHNGEPDQRFYRDGELANQIRGGESKTFMRGGDAVLAEQQGSNNSNPLLLAVTGNNSVLGEVTPDGINHSGYTAHGHRSSASPPAGNLGYNGELHESDTGWQLLGSGYRAYNPLLMRFHSPDSLSPFDEGGINAYGYCEGDPVNFVDPTGHGIFTPLKLFGRLFKTVTTTKSAYAAKVPAGLKALRPGQSVSKLRNIKPADIAGLQEVNEFQVKQVAASQRKMQGLIEKGQKYSYSSAYIEGTQPYKEALRAHTGHSAAAAVSKEALTFAQANEGMAGITNYARESLTKTLKSARAFQAREEVEFATTAGDFKEWAAKNAEVRGGLGGIFPSGKKSKYSYLSD